MSNEETITYDCHLPTCGYRNVWTRDEILRAGTIVTYRGESEASLEIFSLPCKRPTTPRCTGRHKVGLRRGDSK